MKFTPMTDEELEMEGLLPDGTYDAEVVEAEDTQSKKGDDMIKLRLKVWFGPMGETRSLYDYISPHWFHQKWKHFAEAAGLATQYQAGELSADDCLGKSMRAVIESDKQDGYPAQNTVVDYEPSNAAATATRAADAMKGKDDEDLPF